MVIDLTVRVLFLFSRCMILGHKDVENVGKPGVQGVGDWTALMRDGLEKERH